MVEQLQLDSYRVADKVKSALEEGKGDDSTNAMLTDANRELKNLSEPERLLVEHELAVAGLLPNLALVTGLVKDEHGPSMHQVAEVADNESTSSVEGMTARYVLSNFDMMSTSGSGEPALSRSRVEKFDEFEDLQIRAVHAYSDYDGIVDLLEQRNPLMAMQKEKGLAPEDIESLLANPNSLTRRQMQTLNIMREHFDEMSVAGTIDKISVFNFSRLAFPFEDRQREVAARLKITDKVRENYASGAQNSRQNDPTAFRP